MSRYGDTGCHRDSNEVVLHVRPGAKKRVDHHIRRGKLCIDECVWVSGGFDILHVPIEFQKYSCG